MIKAIALDDEPLALDVIAKLAKDVSFIRLEESFTSPVEAKKYLAKNPVDLIFLDINMPGVDGISFYKSLPHPTLVIFTTAYSNYAVKGFELNAIDYLMKPIDRKRFISACKKAEDYLHFLHSRNDGDFANLLVRSEYALVKVPLNQILYLETMDDYIKIHQLNKKPILTLTSIKKILEKLPPSFIRIHRSYVVPVQNIDSVKGRSVFLNGQSLPIGPKFEEAVMQAYKQRSI